MSKTPSLEKLGITDIDAITRYSLRQESQGDILKIYFKKTNPFIARSLKYRFGRSSKKILVDSGRQVYQDIYEMSPFLQKALSELDQLVEQKVTKKSQKELLLSDLAHLEKVLNSKLGEIRQRIEQLKD